MRRPSVSQEPLRMWRMMEESLRKQAEMWRPRYYAQGDDQDNNMELRGEQRDEIVRWLVQLNRTFGFYPETCTLAVTILDRFLQAVKARPKYLRCIGISCFYLAAKTTEEDEVIPMTLELVRESQCGCTVSEVLRMERCILDKLGWSLHNITPLDFLQLFHAMLLTKNPHLLSAVPRMSPSRQMSILTEKLQRCLANHSLLEYAPSTQALALLSLELELFAPEWLAATLWLQAVGRVDQESLIRCREAMARCLASGRKANLAYIYGNREGTPACNRAIKRKMQEALVDSDEEEEDDIYDGIKRLYNEEAEPGAGGVAINASPAPSCAKELHRELMATSPQPLTAVAN